MDGRLAESEVELRTALTQSEDLLSGNPAVSQFRRGVGLKRYYLGILLAKVGKPAEAEAEYRKAMAELRQVADNDPSVAANRSVLAQCRRYLGNLLLQMGKPLAAETECRIAVEIQQRLADENPAETVFHDRLAYDLSFLGDILRSCGRMLEARDLYNRAMGWTEQRVRQHPADLSYRSKSASELWRRGLTLRDLSDPAGAAADIRRARRLCDSLPPGLLNEIETACCHAALASVAGRAGSGVSAEEGVQAADMAMECLNRAVANGYRNANEIRIEAALDPLRGRSDFKNMMAELEKSSQTQQEKK